MQLKTAKDRIFLGEIANKSQKLLNLNRLNSTIKKRKNWRERRKVEIIQTGLFLLGGGSAALEDLKLDEAQRHQSEGQSRHYAGEENEETGDPSVDKPPKRSQRDVLALNSDQSIAVHHQHPSHRDGAQSLHLFLKKESLFGDFVLVCGLIEC